MGTHPVRIAVIGGGVNGLSAGVRILEEFPQVQVTIFTDKISPDTTGDGSAGLWGPFLCGSTPEENMLRWSGGTHKFLKELWSGGSAAEAGITLQPVIRVTTDPEGCCLPYWKDVVYACQPLSPDQLKRFNKENRKEFKGGNQFVTFTSEPTKLLPYLMKRFACKGGIIQIGQKINKIEDLSGFSVIINCSGLGAKELVNDEKMTPIRGQVMRVSAPWLFRTFLDESDDGHYIIPNVDTVVLGGTHQEGDYNEEPDKEDTQFIKKGCEKLIPGLENATFLREWVGLRPGRSGVRLELDTTGKVPVIHNYGHGGSGVTLCWGCAGDVVDLLKPVLNKVTSKL